MKTLQLTILGCGTSTGVPLIHCKCEVCRSRDPKNKRTRASVWIQTNGRSLLIDTSTDLRQQAIRERIPRIDAVLYTHPHSDHILGIDELRSFNFVQKGEIPVYGNDWTVRELTQRFGYAFTNLGNAAAPSTPPEGGGRPQLRLHTIAADASEFTAAGVRVVPLPIEHGSKHGLGFLIKKVAYITDCSHIPETTVNRLQDLKLLVLDCLRKGPHDTHFNLERALKFVDDIRPRRTLLTHLGHDFDYRKTNRSLPRGVRLAYDGLKVTLDV